MTRPGVFVTEAALATPVPSSAPSSAAGALIAPLPSGPTVPTLVTSWFAFTRIFGGLDRAYPATFGANLFFRAGGRELFVNRVVKANAVRADGDILDSGAADVWGTFTAKSKGTYGNDLRIRITVNAADLYDIEVLQEAGVDADASDDTVLESYYNLDLSVFGAQEIVDVFSLRSQFVDFAWGPDGTGLTVATSFAVLPLTGGTDGTGDDDYTTALASLEQVDRTFVLFSPGLVDTDEVTALVAWAEDHKGFVVLDTAANTTVANAVTYASGVGTTTYGAVYYPWLWVPDSTSRSRDALIKVAPSGPVAGLYLGTDATTGVFKAPAGLQATLPGVVALERALTAADLDTLNNDSSPVNAVRIVPGAGAVVMGARTLDQSKSTRYVNIRRSLLFLDREMRTRLEFALFRNNDTRLWTQMTTTLEAFLNGFWAAGGLRGNTPASAYYVKIDRENNSASDVANGIVNVEVGVALQFPAEFIRVKLTQQTQA